LQPLLVPPDTAAVKRPAAARRRHQRGRRPFQNLSLAAWTARSPAASAALPRPASSERPVADPGGGHGRQPSRR
jgi:hypothetical protein